MNNIVSIKSDDIKIVNNEEFFSEVSELYSAIPKIAQPLIKGAKASLSKIEKMLYSAPSFIDVLKSSISKETLQAILTDEQSRKLADGSLELMTKQNGDLMANLVDPKSKRIISTISLEKTNLPLDINRAMINYATQIQMTQIAQEIQTIQVLVEEIREGQEYDRLASAYSCQQKFLQAIVIKNPRLKEMALMRIAADSEDSRNLLMLSQNANLEFIKKQPESFWGKIVSGANPDKVDARINEIRESLYAVNMVSFVEAMAYFEIDEIEAAQQSLQYYAEYIQNTYLNTKGLVKRLDLLDSSPENYWSSTLPNIKRKIEELPFNKEQILLEGELDGN